MTAMIHVVDDDPEVRASLTSLLTAFGIPVRAYASGERFLAEAEPADEDIVLLDLRMPGKSGLDVLSEFRLGGCRARIAVMTGHGDANLLSRCRATGVTEVFEKPFDPAQILALIGAG